MAPDGLRALAQELTRALKPRGPDDDGFWTTPDRTTLLVHTRLAILDCSERGHQPMRSTDGRLTVVLNGEIYNHAELRTELAARGATFRSTSDTEVLLAAYQAWGPRCVERLTGMFAFAVHDAAPEPGAPTLVLARDRLGIKPLLLARRGDVLWFASTLEALLRAGAVARVADREALLHQLAWGAVRQPRTMLADVEALAPGTLLELRPSGTRTVTYWRLADAGMGESETLARAPFAEVAARARALLEDATRHHLVADVEVGAFLSGGIDSAAVVALMQRASGRPVRTFTIGFPDAGSGDDERDAARATAKALGTLHEDATVEDREMAALFPQLVADIDQPSLDGTNTWLVSRLARPHVKVALSGLGGDEMFAGYGHFRWLTEPPPTRPWPGALRTSLAAVQTIRPNRLSHGALVAMSDFGERLTTLRRLLLPGVLGLAAAPDLTRDAEARLREATMAEVGERGDALQRATRAEIAGYLRSTLLRDADVMSLAHGLELRPLLLHHPLVEFALALPAHHRMGPAGVGKRVLTAAVADLLPAEVSARPKRGFELPFARWLAGPLRAEVRDLLGGDAARRLFRPAYRAWLVRRAAGARPPRVLWAWAVLLAWLERNRIEV